MPPLRPPEDGEGDDGESVALDADEHAWWAQRTTEQLWTERAHRPEAPLEGPPRDVLAEHFGADWRTSFDIDPAPAAPDDGWSDGAADAPAPGIDDADDPYAALGVDATASWDEIVRAHRAHARSHHPDLVAQRPAAERADAEDRMRVLNAAYQQLRVRRGR